MRFSTSNSIGNANIQMMGVFSRIDHNIMRKFLTSVGTQIVRQREKRTMMKNLAKFYVLSKRPLLHRSA